MNPLSAILGGSKGQASGPAGLFAPGGFSKSLASLKSSVWNEDAWNEYLSTLGGDVARGIQGAATSPAVFWKGAIQNFTSDGTPVFPVTCSDGFFQLMNQYPERQISRQCWKTFNDGVNCPYTARGSGGSATSCDYYLESPNGCQAHGICSTPTPMAAARSLQAPIHCLQPARIFRPGSWACQ